MLVAAVSGAAHVYAVNAGTGQLRSSLRMNPRVINLERTNLAQLDRQLIPQPPELMTMDRGTVPGLTLWAPCAANWPRHAAERYAGRGPPRPRPRAC